MLTPYENFIINLFLIVFAFLGICLLFLFFVMVRKKDFGLALLRKGKPDEPKIAEPQIKTPPKPRVAEVKEEKAKSSFLEKLGDKVVQYMIEVAQSDDTSLVKDRMTRILSECERLNTMNLPEENKRIISTVLLWAQKFDLDRHINEQKMFRKSTQIIYDFKKHDFKLRVAAD